MNFDDATLVRMGDPATRSLLFDSTSLEQFVTAAYESDGTSFEAPFVPVFDDFQLGLPVDQPSLVEGTWCRAGGDDRVEARFQISGGLAGTGRAEAFWRGSVVAQVATATSRVTTVQASWPDPGTIDAEIVNDLGNLPADPSALEAERGSRFLARLRAGMNQPSAFTDAAFADWRRNLGVNSVGDLIERYRGTAHAAVLQVAYSDATPGPTSPLPLPVAAALLIRNPGFSVAELLAESKRIRTQLEDQGMGVTVAPPLRLRRQVLTVWVVPAATFDDPDWPGAPPGANAATARDSRRAAAGVWLAREGIGLLAVGP